MRYSNLIVVNQREDVVESEVGALKSHSTVQLLVVTDLVILNSAESF